MSRSPHPLLDRLHRGAGTPSQLLARAQAVHTLIDSIAGGLQRVGFDVDDPWARLLEVPLDPGASGLQAALDHLGATDAPAEAARVAARAPRASLASADGQPARVADAGGLAHGTRRPSRPLAGAPAQQAAVRHAPAAAQAAVWPRASAAALTPQAAAAAWQQRAAAAGTAVEDAFFSPLRAHKPPRAVGPASESARALRPMQAQTTARPVPADDAASSANTGATLLQVAGLPAPVLPRLNAVLARIEQRSVAPPVERMPVATREWRIDAGPRQAGVAGLPPGRSAGFDAPGDAAPWSAPERAAVAHGAAPNSVAVSAGGFRGLAARAASAAGSLQRSPAAEPDRTMPRTPDDEQLVEQLARLLRREAERDGIDTSDTAS